MKVATLSTALLVGSVSAFAPQTAFVRTTTSLEVHKESSRADFFVQLGGMVASATLFPGMASAAKYGGFGAGSPEVLDPKEAIVDREILATSAVQSALSGVKAYAAAVKSIQDALETNPQANIGPYLRKEFDFSKLRQDLNVLNSAFDEDTQRGTDRIIRIILQDITELETANNQKEGIERSDRRLDIMKGKLDKLAKAFADYLAFAQ